MTSTAKPEFSLRRLLENLCALVLAAGFAYLLVIKADPLGFDAATKSYAEGVFYRVVGASERLNRWFYSGAHGNEYGQNNTAMVWVQDDDLRATGTLWPMPYIFHSKIINNLLEYAPLAIFVDISFTDARKDETLPELAATLRKAHDKNIPIFVASLAANDPENKILPGMAAACARVLPTYRMDPDVDGIEKSYPLIHSEIRTHLTIFERQCGFDSSHSNQSAALALYRAFLESKGETFNAATFSEPMEVFWAMGSIPSINRKLYRCEKKELFSPHPDQRWSDLIWNIFTGKFFDDLKQDCPHTAVVKVRDLLNTNASDPEARALFSGKLVLYGANIKGAGDEIVEPTHSARMPGVYLHAMALDNLLVFGDQYKRLNEQAEIYALITLFLIFGLTPALYSSFFKEKAKDERPHLESIQHEDIRHLCHFTLLILTGGLGWLLHKTYRLLRLLAKNALIFIVVLLVCAYFYFFQNVAPMNWIKFIGVAIMYEVIESRLTQAGRIHQFSNWVILQISKSNKEGDNIGCAQFLVCLSQSCWSQCRLQMLRKWARLQKLISPKKS